ncbi:fungal-specific transcription factor [Plectosphaerella plurivora]|uniref:Fungal-specific transcription factor n=1 Tax=Plectosphaerella plurivora TaxID=936078 RepID=A0A9P9A7X0_9PEZI|nr:fungal-specific transcription factor [Plectosphaerella plurivora]
MDGATRLRSSIACLRCRKSKIKCDNSGHLDTACENCIRSGHKCEWPDPAPPISRKSEPSTTTRTDKDAGPERKRVRRTGDAAQLDGQRYAEEILSAQFIDRDLWDKILITYRRHFSTELPFLHIPTVKSRIFDLLRGRKPANPDFNLVLLGLLALTARFHPDLVKYVEHLPQDRLGSQRPRGGRATKYEAVAASDFFAKALDTAMGSVMDAFTSATVERVQAWLMLGLHEWMSRNHGAGTGAWMYVGTAGRMAQALRLNCGDRSSFGEKHARPPLTEDMIIEREVRRRTMFSCFILDRLMSCGRDRVSFLRSEDLLIQLPCTEEDFDLSRMVQTGFLNCDGPADFRITRNPNLLSRFVQLIDLWGEVFKHSYAGGRFKERTMPPWDPRSTFSRLQQRVELFEESLEIPDAFLGYSVSNYFRHDNGSSTYVLLHMLLAQCKIMMHREYVPFVPIKCEKPQGPVDEPTFPAETVPPGYWEAGARELFKAGRNIVNLIDLCGDKLPHSSLTAFVIWSVAFVGLYARAFPQMDVEKHMVNVEDVRKPGDDAAADSSTVGPTKTTFDALAKLAQYSGVAAAYVAQFQEVDEFFVKIVADHHRNAGRRRGGTPHKLGVRHGGDTGGLEEWIKKADRLTSNGFIIEDERPLHPMDGSDRSRGSTRERSSSLGPDASQGSTAARGVRPGSAMVMGQHTPLLSAEGGTARLGQSPTRGQSVVPGTPADGHVEGASGEGGIDWAVAPNMCLGTGFIGGDNIFGGFYDFSGQMPFDMWPAGPEAVDDVRLAGEE